MARENTRAKHIYARHGKMNKRCLFTVFAFKILYIYFLSSGQASKQAGPHLACLLAQTGPVSLLVTKSVSSRDFRRCASVVAVLLLDPQYFVLVLLFKQASTLSKVCTLHCTFVLRWPKTWFFRQVGRRRQVPTSAHLQSLPEWMTLLMTIMTTFPQPSSTQPSEPVEERIQLDRYCEKKNLMKTI